MNRKSAKSLEVLVNKIDKILLMTGIPSHRLLRRHYFELYHVLVKNHGKREAVRQLKALYNESLRFAAGLRIYQSTPIWCKRDKDNFPIVLKPFKSFLLGSLAEKRYSLSILRIYESFRLPPIKDFSSITDPSEGARFYAESLCKPFEYFLNESRFSKFIQEDYKRITSKFCVWPWRTALPHHFSTKRGIGGPAILTAGSESATLDDKTIKLLSEFISSIIPCRKASLIEGNLKLIREPYIAGVLDLSPNKHSSKPCLGRIAFLPDKGGKTRVVAIGNYWIQDAFVTLHEVLYSILRGLPNDGTYDQKRISEVVKETTSTKPVWSFDLTAATDRFPVCVQTAVMKSLNKRMGETWDEILKSISFLTEGDQLIKYSVGQPMGLYSSWAAFSLTHHYIIQYCAYKERVRFPFRDYAVLGDDVAIWNRNVALRYRELLTGLDVQISKPKSITPDDYSSNEICVAEFAKRVFSNGIEITPIPPDICESIKSVYDIPELLVYLKDHNFLQEPVPVSRIIKLFKFNSKQSDDLVYLIRIKECLGAKLMVTVDIPSPPNIEKITVRTVNLLRLEELSDKIRSIEKWKEFRFSPEQEAMLDKHLGKSPRQTNVLAPIRTIISQREVQFEKVSKKIKDALASEMDLDNIVPLDEMEYVPFIDLDNLVKLAKGKTKRFRVHRGTYIKKLLDRSENSDTLSKTGSLK